MFLITGLFRRRRRSYSYGPRRYYDV
jgi:hypothetical protein